jgi:hypothetical protein
VASLIGLATATGVRSNIDLDRLKEDCYQIVIIGDKANFEQIVTDHSSRLPVAVAEV